ETFTQFTTLRLRHGLELTEALLHALLLFRVETPELPEAFTYELTLLGAALAPLAHTFFHHLTRRLTPATPPFPAMATGRRQWRLRHRGDRYQQRQCEGQR